ncbi:hypothetical protein ACKWTF_011627 [Chironomus riparius]
MLIDHCNHSELADVLLRLLVNLTNPAMLFFRSDLPKDNAGRRTYLDLVEISHTYKEAFANSSAVWKTLAKRLQRIIEIDAGERSEEQGLVLERILVLTRNVLQVPTNPQNEKRVDNDISVHDQILLALHDSGMLELILYILSSKYENQYYLHALEITYLIFREQKVETLADSSVHRSDAEKLADEQALITARKMEKAKVQQHLPPARHSRFGGTYVYKNMKSVSDRDLICHQPLERVVEQDLSRDKKKIKPNFRLAKDEDKYERQSAFCVRLVLREFCLEILTKSFNNLIRQVRRVLERNHVNNEGSGHDQSYLLWSIRFFLEFNRLNGFILEHVSEAVTVGTIHWICSQIQNDSEMIQTDKRRKINWNRRLQLGIHAYREFLQTLQVMELDDDEEVKGLVAKLKTNIFYVVEYREMILHLLLGYNENHFTRMYLRDLIDTTNVYMKMMEKFCQGSVVVQTKVKKDKKKKKKADKNATKKVKQSKKPSKEEVMERLENEWDSKISSNVAVVLGNDINLPEEEQPEEPFNAELEISEDEQREKCKQKIHNFLRDEDFERAVLLLRAGRKSWPDVETFGRENAQPEEELMILKEIYMMNQEGDNDNVDDFWKEFDGSESEDNDADAVGDENEESNEESDEEEEEETELKEITMKFSDIEKRLLNPKVVRACTWALQSWEKMSYREIKSAVTILHRIAVNLKMPIMLMHAQLFRIFQQVFNVPKDNRYEELRRIGIYVVRQFVKLVPRNPKIFAELLFFSSHRECHEIEHGYDEPFGEHEGKNKAWSEEQEEDLRQLFMRNQESPETDQDVIDWIVENLKERNRTRRGVIKKLKELGLIFKAPTKKSNAAAANKNLFTKDEDEKLRELYDEHRLDKHCLAKIMEVFKGKRSKKAIVKRMIQLHLIADETEILPPKKSRKKNHEDGDSERQSESDERSESDESDNDDNNSRIGRNSQQSMSVSRSNYQISQRDVTNYRIELEESLKEAIEWIIESLKEAAEDFEEVSDEISDAIPIVPYTESQKMALDNPQFQGLLRSINLIEPHDAETYWKIPANMLPNDLQKRAQLLAGEIPTISQHDTAKNSDSENDNDDDSDLFSRLRAQHNALVYNHSDNEDDRPKSSISSKKTNKPQQKVAKLNTKLIKKLHPQLSVEHGSTMQWLVELLDEKIANKATKSTLIDEMLIVPSTNDQKESLKDENFKKLLAALSLIPPNGNESYWQIPESLTTKELKKRMELLQVKNTQNDTTDESDSEQMIIKRKKPKATRESQDDDDDFGINTQELKERLAELESSSDDDHDMTDMNQSTKQQNKKIINRHILDSSDDDHSGADDAEMTKQIIKANEIKEKRKSEKRERSQSPDENEMNASNNNSNNNPMKKIRRIIDSDDDE